MLSKLLSLTNKTALLAPDNLAYYSAREEIPDILNIRFWLEEEKRCLLFYSV